MLHAIAFIIVLIKAFKILMSYAQTHHLNIKYLVEIAIIAPAIEILFNSHSYSLEILALMGAFGVANLLVYVIWFSTFQSIAKDSH